MRIFTWSIKMILSLIVLFAMTNQSHAQYYQPLTAKSYIADESHPTYLTLTEKLKQGEVMSAQELDWLKIYKVYLDSCYLKLPESEKTIYLNIISKGSVVNLNNKPNGHYQAQQSDIHDDDNGNVELKHYLYSGYYGMYYGLAAIYISGMTDSGLAAGLPFISAGSAMLMPALLRNHIGEINTNSMILASHGRVMGASTGFATAILIGGNPSGTEDAVKPHVALSAVASIAGGYLGLYLGRTKNWSEGRTELYTLCSKTFGVAALLGVASTETQQLRSYAGSYLVGNIAGYGVANYMSNKNNYTRGDAIAIEGLTIMTSGLGFALWADQMSAEPKNIWLPAVVAGAGFASAAKLTENTKLSTKQGRRVEFATAGGALLGLGLAMMTETNEPWPVYSLSYFGGTSAYLATLIYFKSKNSGTASTENIKDNKFSFNFSPQNLLFGKQIKVHEGVPTWIPPAFELKWKF